MCERKEPNLHIEGQVRGLKFKNKLPYTEQGVGMSKSKVFRSHYNDVPKITGEFQGDNAELDDFRKALSTINIQRRRIGKKPFSYLIRVKEGKN